MSRAASVTTPPSAMGWGLCSTRGLYRFLTSVRPVPAIQGKKCLPRGWALTWARLAHPAITMGARDAAYRVLHNITLTREREHRMGKVLDPYCPAEAVRQQAEGPEEEGGAGPGLVAVGGPVGSVEHCHCHCSKVHALWAWLKGKCLLKLGLVDCQDTILLYLQHPPGRASLVVTKLITSYMLFVWTEGRRGTRLSVKNLTSFLSYHQSDYAARVSLNFSWLGQ